ncbi:hypothetical protein DdX_17677 [Ditylenchus destructor]|uniref:Uncharacterized protein n=1 Tax=Ditylenchus destructor TaxID=166010 RepID=A0AAD4MM53_9BILA|nr:hypothetical protein DdX_17677 [Ditylenchus destructor]
MLSVRLKKWALFLIFTGSMQFFFNFYKPADNSNPTYEMEELVTFAPNGMNRGPVEIKPISKDSDLADSGIKPNRSRATKLLPFNTSIRNTGSNRMSQTNLLVSPGLSEKLSIKRQTPTPMSTTTRPYFEIRSEHYYRYALSHPTYQAIKQHKPYTYVIVPVMNSRNETDEFKTAQETIECYAALHKYSYRVLYADGTDEHSRHLCTQKDVRMLN